MVAAAAVLTACTAESPPDQESGVVESRAGIPAELAARAAHTMTALDNGRLLVVGGCVTDGCGTAAADSWIIEGRDARPTAPLNYVRDAHSATLLADGRVLAAGGFAEEGTPALDTAEIYDPETERWAEVAALTTGRGAHGAALMGDGTVLLAGGWARTGGFTATTEIFEPLTATFRPGPALPMPVAGVGAASIPNGCVLLVGGEVRSAVPTDLALTVCPDGTVTEVGPLRQARFKHATVPLPSGDVLVVGGTADDRELLTSTEIFDARSQSLRPGPDLTAGRYKLGATILPDGRVAVAGGSPGIEVIDVASGEASVVGAARDDIASFSTLGVTGGVLVVLGGYDESIDLTRLGLLIDLEKLTG